MRTVGDFFKNAVIPLRFLISFLPKGSAPKQRDVIDGNVLQCELCENRNKAKNHCSTISHPWKDCAHLLSLILLFPSVLLPGNQDIKGKRLSI